MIEAKVTYELVPSLLPEEGFTFTAQDEPKPVTRVHIERIPVYGVTTL